MELNQGGLVEFRVARGKERIFRPSSENEPLKNLYNMLEKYDCQLRNDLGQVLKC